MPRKCAEAPPCPVPSSPGHVLPREHDPRDPALIARAVTLGATPAELADEALFAAANGHHVRYLQLLRSASPERWRARIKAVYAACDGNGAAVARRLGLTPPGLSKLVATDDELCQAIAIRWPHAQRHVTRSNGGHTDQR